MAIADVAVSLISGQTKDEALVASNVSVTVPAGGIMIGFQQVDDDRQVEILSKLRQLADFVVETGQLSDDVELVAGLGINQTKGQSIVATPITPPTNGILYIQVDNSYPLNKGSGIFYNDFGTALKALLDEYFKGV